MIFNNYVPVHFINEKQSNMLFFMTMDIRTTPLTGIYMLNENTIIDT